MRRSLILALLVCALVAVGGTASGATLRTTQAAEGDPGDFCSYSPDRPFGWDFNGACEGHDGCLLELPDTALLPDRLGCDDSFFEDLLQAPHLETQRVCGESPFCTFLAALYHRVVRYVTLLSAGAIELPVAALDPGGAGDGG